VHDLSRALARLGASVHVITCPAQGTPRYQFVEGVHVHRVEQARLTSREFMEWVQQLNEAMVELAGELVFSGPFDLVHAHDWLVGDAAQVLRNQYRLPLVATIHATEYGRNRGIHNELQRRIHELDARFAAGATRVICCSDFMAAEVKELFKIPGERIHILPNGVDPANLGIPRKLVPGWREPKSEGKTVFFIGRLVPEKGVQVLLEAFSRLLLEIQDLKLLVGGIGPYEGTLRAKAAELGLAERVVFLGYLDEKKRNEYFKMADVAVFPSLYEPFGIVALEAMATQIPVIVSDTGGLSEVVAHGIDGYKVPPGRPDILSYYIREVLVNPGLARDLTRQAWKKVLTVYDWQNIALGTIEVYREAMAVAATGVKAAG